MACRTRKPHYHYYEGINFEVFCNGCGAQFTSGWMRCHDSHKLCDLCYWADHKLRWKPDYEEQGR